MADRPTVVLDTSVLESALRSRRGASFAVLSMVGAGAFDIAVSTPLVLEYEAVLTRAGRNPRTVADVIDYLCAVGIRQRIFYLWRPGLPDPADDMVLELAVAADCGAIVTHNRRDFRAAAAFGVRVLGPAELLREIGALP